MPRPDGDKPPVSPIPLEEATAASLTVVSTRGRGSTSLSRFDFGQLLQTPLIMHNQKSIRTKLLANKPESSLKSDKEGLAFVARYVEWYSSIHGSEPTVAASVDRHFCYELIVYLETAEVGDPVKSTRVRFFRRFMEAIGVDQALLPSNPFSNSSSQPDDRPALTAQKLRELLKQAKFEAQVVLRRLSELEALPGGHDPRRANGGRNGDWGRAECRLWIMKNVFKLEIRSFDEWRFEKGMGGELRGLEGRPGAPMITAGGTVERQVGWKGHLRWFFPWSDDLAPFIVLLLIRTGLNLGTIAEFKANRAWCEPFPFRLGDISDETHAFIVTHKTRGRQKPLNPSKPVRLPSPVRPWSYPYRILETVEKLTGNLRNEVLRRCKELHGKGLLTKDEQDEFNKLISIKNDLFLFKTEQGITSLAQQSRSGSSPHAVLALLSRAGLDINIGQLRDAPLLFWYAASGQNIFVVQMLAGHARPETSTLYMRRKVLLDNLADRAKDVFSHSIEFIKAGTYDVNLVRQSLRHQHFNEKQIDCLVDDRNATRWGNRCATPTNPPREFAHGTSKGEPCRAQDCIDGCPNARWFRDSIAHVAKQLVVAEQVQSTLGFESTDGSSTGDRIDRCHELLSQWPEKEAQEAVSLARQQIGDGHDLFLGAAL